MADEQKSFPGTKRPVQCLLWMGYLLAFIFAAGWLSSLDNTCVVVVYTPVEIALILVFPALIVGYSQASAGRIPWHAPRVFWSVSTFVHILPPAFLFYAMGQGWARHLMRDFSSLGDSLHPFQPAYALEAIGGMISTYVLLWMPIAAMLSLYLLLTTCGRTAYARDMARGLKFLAAGCLLAALLFLAGLIFRRFGSGNEAGYSWKVLLEAFVWPDAIFMTLNFSVTLALLLAPCVVLLSAWRAPWLRHLAFLILPAAVGIWAAIQGYPYKNEVPIIYGSFILSSIVAGLCAAAGLRLRADSHDGLTPLTRL